MGHSLWGHKESDMAERVTHFSLFFSTIICIWFLSLYLVKAPKILWNFPSNERDKGIFYYEFEVTSGKLLRLGLMASGTNLVIREPELSVLPPTSGDGKGTIS